MKIIKTQPYMKKQAIYSPTLDGSPLSPNSISDAEKQIRYLAHQIRTTFGLDPLWKDHKMRIAKVMELLEQAANTLDDGTFDEGQRNNPHQYVVE